MELGDLRKLSNKDKITLECNSCNCLYDRKVRDIRTSIKNNKFRVMCSLCAKHEKRGEFKNCLLCDKKYYTVKCNQKSKFCSRSCSAKFNNRLRGKNKVSTDNKFKHKKNYNYGIHSKKCCHCGNEFSGYYKSIKTRKYCSLLCSKEHRKQQYWLPKKQLIEQGEVKLSEHLETNNSIFKRYLIEKYEAKCMQCGWSEINQFTGRIPIELEHKDGNCENNKLYNLELLCPNCHSLTSTYKGANRNKTEGGSKRYQMWKQYFK
jgi:hypothetical protein